MSQLSIRQPSRSNTAFSRSKAAPISGSMGRLPWSRLQPIESPCMSRASSGRPGGKGAWTTTGQRGSGPASAERKRAASATVRAMGPGVFMLCHIRGLGTSGIIQEVGRWPTMLFQAAGLRTEPPMSEPSASAHRPAARAAPEPPLLAPGASAGFQGLRVGPKTGLSQVFIAIVYSGVLSLPRMMAPAAFSRSTTR